MRVFKFLIISCLILFFSFCVGCQRSGSSYDLQLDHMMLMYGKDIEKDIMWLKESLVLKKDSLEKRETGLKYVTIIQDMEFYFIYLERLDSISLAQEKNLFYTNTDEITSEGKVFIKKSKELMEQFDQLAHEPFLKRRIEALLGVSDVKNEENIYFRYMDYYFLGLPPKTFNYLIKMRKRDVQLIMHEILEY